ncbi:MAG: hypothetical protein CM15mP22_7350 [Gammaproteobacteria bacterium]|nr:MAG: hypothetical protein CM15mP22_7350 [Gammaproteobacteria bacterium]
MPSSNLEENLSDILPISGSLIASNISAKNIAVQSEVD